MLDPRKIKRKIRSVGNIKKITRAMEMVSASKLKKVQGRLVTLRPFAAKLEAIMNNLSRSLSHELMTHPLLHSRIKPRFQRGKRNISLIVIASNKGLCGSYNTRLLLSAESFIAEQINSNVQIIAIGKKVIDYFSKTKLEIASSITQLPKEITLQSALDIINPIVRNYEKGLIDEIWTIYTEFVNALSYRPRIKRLVPILGEKQDPDTGQLIPPTPLNKGGTEREDYPSIHLPTTKLTSGAKAPRPFEGGYLFEPKPEIVLDMLIPRYLETTFYRVLLDALASEHSARMMAMRNATDNADEVIDYLKLNFNKARQASITKELLDIIGGVEAMR